MDGGKHAMLRDHDAFDGLAADFTRAALLGDTPANPDGPLARVLAGETTLQV